MSSFSLLLAENVDIMFVNILFGLVRTMKKITDEKSTKKVVKKKKIRVLIDSDVANEIDDQFAICYALSRPDNLEVLGITIAPFRVSWQKNLEVKDSLIDSKNEAYRILRLFGIKHDTQNPFVYLGSAGFLSEGYEETSPAVEKIIELAKSKKDFYVCCLGTLTNVALAIKKAPSIASKLKIVWLGTENILLDNFNDSNYRKDVDAFDFVMKSGADLTIFPTELARAFVTSTYEFSRNIKGNQVAKYLHSLMDKFVFTKENLGIKTIYDIGPVAYLLNMDKFGVKEIDAKMLKVDTQRTVHYVVSNPKNSFVWVDFLNSINSNKDVYLKPKVFFVSDTHFGDYNKIRRKQVPCKTVEEMNEMLVKRWNNEVGTRDIVYHMGDFGDYNFVKKLNGKITLICGNMEKHDAKNDFVWFRNKLIKLGFEDVIFDGMYLDEKIFGEKVYLTHKPSDCKKDCMNIFGHVHTLSLVKKFGFNACVSFHYYAPVKLETAKKYLNFVKNELDNDALI